MSRPQKVLTAKHPDREIFDRQILDRQIPTAPCLQREVSIRRESHRWVGTDACLVTSLAIYNICIATWKKECSFLRPVNRWRSMLFANSKWL